MIFRTQSGSWYEVEDRRMRRLTNCTTPRLATNAPHSGVWAPIEGHSEIQIGQSALFYWKTVVGDDGRWRIESTITSPVVEILEGGGAA
jgi:hypothetical protein